MSGGESAKTMYDRIVDMFRNGFPAFDFSFLPLPPAAAMIQLEKDAMAFEGKAMEMEGKLVQGVEIDNETKRLNNQMLEQQIKTASHPSAPPSDNESDQSSEEKNNENAVNHNNENNNDNESDQSSEEKNNKNAVKHNNENESVEPSAPPSKDNEKESDQSGEEKNNKNNKNNNENESVEPSAPSKDNEPKKEVKIEGGDGGISFTKEECSFF